MGVLKTTWKMLAVVGGILAMGEPYAQTTEFELEWSSTNEQARTFLGGRNGKLVYVNFYAGQKALHYVDFSEGSAAPAVHRIPAAVNPTAPILSPDGKWVVYVAANDVYGENGATPPDGKGSVYICRLADTARPVLIAPDSAFDPRFVQGTTPAGKLTVIFPTRCVNLGWTGLGTTKAVDIDTTGGRVTVGVPRQLTGHGSYNGGLSVDGRYLGAGGGQVALLDLQSGSTLPKTLTSTYTGQACNPSISSSRTRPDMLMYLDFGCSSAVAPAGINQDSTWGQWQIIWIGVPSASRSDKGDWVRYYKYPVNPPNTYAYKDTFTTATTSKFFNNSFDHASWHHQEWSNHPYYATSAVYVDRGYRRTGWNNGTTYHTFHQERVGLIDLRSEAYHEIGRRKNLAFHPPVDSGRNNGIYWPSLWVDVPSSFQEDSTAWRKSSAVRNSGRRVNGSHSISIGPDGLLLASTAPLREVSVFTVLGSVLSRTTFATPTRTAALKRRAPGTYFVQAVGLNGEVSTVRWTVAR